MVDKIRKCLPEKSYEDFDGIVEQKILGASKHISMIGQMIEDIAVDGKENEEPLNKIIDRIETVCDFFIATRGEASQAVSNAIYLMIKGLNDLREAEMAYEKAIDQIIETKNHYAVSSAEAVDKVIAYAVEMARKYESLFVYDYSSTVDKFLMALAEDGKPRQVYIAESRIINGGFPFVENCLKAGYKVEFVVDAAMMHTIKKCDACFMGAESFYPDGTGFNTTGSDIVGLVCDTYEIPLYFLTPMIKVDVRPVYGQEKDVVYNDVKNKLIKEWSAAVGADAINFAVPELLGVPAKHIRAFVTELGVIPSNQMYTISLAYSDSLK